MKALQRLKKAASALNPRNQLLGILSPHLGQLTEYLQQLERPEEEGGILKDNQSEAGYFLKAFGGKVVVALVPIEIDEQGRRIMHHPLSVMPIEDLLNPSQDGNEAATED